MPALTWLPEAWRSIAVATGIFVEPPQRRFVFDGSEWIASIFLAVRLPVLAAGADDVEKSFASVAEPTRGAEHAPDPYLLWRDGTAFRRIGDVAVRAAAIDFIELVHPRPTWWALGGRLDPVQARREGRVVAVAAGAMERA